MAPSVQGPHMPRFLHDVPAKMAAAAQRKAQMAAAPRSEKPLREVVFRNNARAMVAKMEADKAALFQSKEGVAARARREKARVATALVDAQTAASVAIIKAAKVLLVLQDDKSAAAKGAPFRVNLKTLSFFSLRLAGVIARGVPAGMTDSRSGSAATPTPSKVAAVASSSSACESSAPKAAEPHSLELRVKAVSLGGLRLGGLRRPRSAFATPPPHPPHTGALHTSWPTHRALAAASSTAVACRALRRHQAEHGLQEAGWEQG